MAKVYHNDCIVDDSRFGPDGATIDALTDTIKLVTQSCHEAIDRHDYRQVVGLVASLRALDHALRQVHPRRFA